MGGWRKSREPDNLVVVSLLRNPVALFGVILAVGLGAIAVGMTAFGGTSGGPSSAPPPNSPAALTPAQFKRAGVGICMSLRPQLIWVANLHKHRPRNLRQVTRDFRTLTSIFGRLTTDLHRVVPPASRAFRYRHLLRKVDRFEQGMRRLNHLAETHQWRQLVLLARSSWWKDIGKLFGPPRKMGRLRCGNFKLA
jgi:hypothetical protein